MIIRPGKDAGQQVIYAEGNFTTDDSYVISHFSGEAPFGSLLCAVGSDYSVEIEPDGTGGSWLGKAPILQYNRMGKAWYIKDRETGETWSPFYNPVCENADDYQVSFSPGVMSVRSLHSKIDCTLTISVSAEHPCEVWHIRLENKSAHERTLMFATYVEPQVDSPLETGYLEHERAVFMRKPLESIGMDLPGRMARDTVLFHSSTLAPSAVFLDKSDFIGDDGSLRSPKALDGEESNCEDGIAIKPIAGFTMEIDLPIEGEAEFGFCFGAAHTAEEAMLAVAAYTKTDSVAKEIENTREHWRKTCSSIHLDSQDRVFDALVNTWLPYEAYAGWIRSQHEHGPASPVSAATVLRRLCAISATAPYACREALINFAGRVSVLGTYSPDGETQLMLPPSELLWLAICTAKYVAETGNVGVLSQTIPLNGGPVLSLREHCERAIRACINSPQPADNNYDANLEHALMLWSYIEPDDPEFTEHLRLIRDRRTTSRPEYPEQRTLPRRVRYLQSVSHSLSNAKTTDLLHQHLDPLNGQAGESDAAYHIYAAMVEEILGIVATNEGLILHPSMPDSWAECQATRRFREDTYIIHIKRSESNSKRKVSVVVDGEPVLGESLPYFGDGREHMVDVTVH
ncbi:hypothetical protein LLG39_00915 [bacterium]|nr:hypothetical protein [bacterium]